jgi:hypothetical protein
MGKERIIQILRLSLPKIKPYHSIVSEESTENTKGETSTFPDP